MNKPMFAQHIAAIISAVTAAIEASFPVSTRKEAVEKAEALGLRGEALDFAASLGAQQRDAERGARALATALSWTLAWDEDEVDDAVFQANRIPGFLRKVAEGETFAGQDRDIWLYTCLDAWVLLKVDAIGVGGSKGIEGASTARHPFLTRLGKGRKQARDGAAWSSAIEAAINRLESILSGLGANELELAPAEGDVGAAFTDAATGKREAIPTRFIHPTWAQAVAGRRISELIPQGADASAEIAAWGEVFNQASQGSSPPASSWLEGVYDHLPPEASGYARCRHYRGEEVLRLLSGEDVGTLLTQGRADDLLFQVGKGVMPEVVHADHNIPRLAVAWAVAQMQGEGVQVGTFRTPGKNHPCGLHGPAMGDAPIPEAEVILRQRTEDRPPSRLVKRPLRFVPEFTVVALIKGESRTVFTVYGGPEAPREPGDPSMSPEQEAEARAFWAQHALSLVE